MTSRIVADSDALDVINFLNAFGADGEGEGESAAEFPPQSSPGAVLHTSVEYEDELLTLLALEQSLQRLPRPTEPCPKIRDMMRALPKPFRRSRSRRRLFARKVRLLGTKNVRHKTHGNLGHAVLVWSSLVRSPLARTKQVHAVGIKKFP